MTASSDSFPTEIAGLPASVTSPVLELDDGDQFELRIGPVVKELGEARVRMLAYDGSIPGPTLRVQQGSEVVIRVLNEGDLEGTVHWHGLRLDNRYDGTDRDAVADRGRGELHLPDRVSRSGRLLVSPAHP